MFLLDDFDCLLDFDLVLSIPIKLESDKNLKDNLLELEMWIGEEDWPLLSKCSINLNREDFDIISEEKKAMSFERDLIQLQKMIPPNYRIQSCLFCALSSYAVGVGDPSFGDLLCFKKMKDDMIKVSEKGNYFDLTIKGIKSNQINHVQETFYCQEFIEITPDTWVYKDTVFE